MAPEAQDARQGELAAHLQVLRREAALKSLAFFAKAYLRHHFQVAPSRMHRELVPLLEQAATARGARLAVAAPRGSAKSTLVSLAYALWCMIRGQEPFILLLSATADQAAGLLADLKAELEDNPLLRTDFPDVAEPPGIKPSPKRWREREIVTRNRVRVKAIGAGQGLRGIKHHGERPSLIILDDIEGEEEAWSADRREKRWSWLQRAVLKAGVTGSTNVVAVGTLVHYDAVLARLVGVGSARPQPGWEARTYRSVLTWSGEDAMWERFENLFVGKEEDEELGSGPDAARAYFAANESAMLAGTEVLWPERESYVALMEMRIVEGRIAFDTEKQNEPIDRENCIFDLDKLTYWDDVYPTEEDLVEALGGDPYVYGAWDPSMGRDGMRGDFSAVVTILEDDKNDRFYVVDAVLEKKPPSAMIQIIVELARMRDYYNFVVESNQFQRNVADMLEDEADRARVRLRVDRQDSTGSKEQRIMALEPLVTSGRLVFSRRHRLLLQQLREFPMSKHDDGPDALEMAVSAATSYGKVCIGLGR